MTAKKMLLARSSSTISKHNLTSVDKELQISVIPLTAKEVVAMMMLFHLKRPKKDLKLVSTFQMFLNWSVDILIS